MASKTFSGRNSPCSCCQDGAQSLYSFVYDASRFIGQNIGIIKLDAVTQLNAVFCHSLMYLDSEVRCASGAV
jgi:hypothetical protein